MPIVDQQRMQEQERRPTSEKRDDRRVGNVERRRPREKRSQSIPANSLESNTDRSVEKDSSEDTNAFVQNTLSDGLKKYSVQFLYIIYESKFMI